MISNVQREDCSGCFACASGCPAQCIAMECDDEGFWYPKADTAHCVGCGLCENICPIVHNKEIHNSPIAYAAYNRDEAARLKSSSGGVFTLLAQQVINSGGVVFGARFTDEFQVVHDYTETAEGLACFRGSKYVQSRIGDSYKQAETFLQNGRVVLFTGTPCQIGGLKAYLHQEYENLICQDIICHGVPSLKVWSKYLQSHESCVGSPIENISFRDKSEGWKKFSLSIGFINGKQYIQNLSKDSMMTAFLKNLCLRPSCYHCAYKTVHRQSDITLADYWGIEQLHPEMDDNKGTSLVIINSEKGAEWFAAVSGRLVYQETDLNKAIRYNTAATEAVKVHPKRAGFFKRIDTEPFDKAVAICIKESLPMRIKNLMYRVRAKFVRIKSGENA